MPLKIAFTPKITSLECLLKWFTLAKTLAKFAVPLCSALQQNFWSVTLASLQQIGVMQYTPEYHSSLPEFCQSTTPKILLECGVECYSSFMGRSAEWSATPVL